MAQRSLGISADRRWLRESRLARLQPTPPRARGHWEWQRPVGALRDFPYRSRGGLPASPAHSITLPRRPPGVRAVARAASQLPLQHFHIDLDEAEIRSVEQARGHGD